VTVVDLSYAAHDPSFSPLTGGRTLAYLVKPQGDGPFAGVIYLHWLGHYNNSRAQYLDEAITLAQHGAVSLLLQGYFPWMTSPKGAADRPLIIGQEIELRRAVDFLLSQPEVDPERLGYVGHDYGAMYGGMLAGTDPRLKTYVLLAGTPSFADWSAYFGSIDFLKPENYLPVVEDLDPIQHISNAAPASLFFQFAQNDRFIPEEAGNRFYEAASEPKKIEWYTAATHELKVEAALQARQDWLADQLNLTPFLTPAEALASNLHWFDVSAILYHGTKTIYFDPYNLSGDLPTADLILISHGHSDHADLESLQKIVGPGTVLIISPSVEGFYKNNQEAIGVAATILGEGETTETGGVTVEAVAAYDTRFHLRQNGGTGFVVSIDGGRIYFAGGTGFYPEMAEIESDVTIYPFYKLDDVTQVVQILPTEIMFFVHSSE